MSFKKIFLFIFLMIIFFLSNSFAGISWRTYKTDNFIVFYKPGYEYFARETLNYLEQTREMAENLIGNSVLNLPVVIEDAGSMANGFANPVFYNINLFTSSPSSDPGLNFVENWLKLVGLHEHIHILHLTKAGGVPENLRKWFGNLFAPNLYSPWWIVEGIAVYAESQISPHQGRLNDGFFSAYMKSRVIDDRFPTILEATYPFDEYPYYNSIYLYGGMFHSFLSEQYGEEKFALFYEKFGSSGLSYFSSFLPSISLDRAAEKVYGKSYELLWIEWQRYLEEKNKNVRYTGQKLTNTAGRKKYLLYHNNKLYYTLEYPVKTGAFHNFNKNKIIEYDLSSGQERILVQSVSRFNNEIQILNNYLYYSVNEIKKGYNNTSFSRFGFLSEISRVDLFTKKSEKLFTKEIKSFKVVNDFEILFSKDLKDSFGSNIYNYNIETQESEFLFKTDYILCSIQSYKNRFIVTAKPENENYSIFYLDLLNDTLIPIVRTPFFEGHHYIYEDKLFYAANYDNQYRIYAHNLITNDYYIVIDDIYSVYPAYNPNDNNLYYIGINSYGNDIYYNKLNYRSINSPKYDFIVNKPVDVRNIQRGKYFDNIKTLIPPAIRFPIMHFDDDNSFLGSFIFGIDALGHYNYFGPLGYNFERNKFETNMTFLINLFNPFTVSFNYDNFDDVKSFKSSIEYPLYNSITNGLNNVSVGFYTELMNDFNRFEIAPFIHATANYPKTKIFFQSVIPNETKDIKSDFNRTGVYSDIIIRRYLNESHLNLTFKHYYDPDEPGPVFDSIRGYSDELTDKKGYIFNVDYSNPFYKIRRGHWNPNLFFEDLIANFFVDGAVSNSELNQFAGGLEIILETHFAYVNKLNIGLRHSINKSGRISRDFFVLSDLFF